VYNARKRKSWGGGGCGERESAEEGLTKRKEKRGRRMREA
jgi:hypothetical protein